MKRLWQRFLDRFWPVYVVGHDLAYKDDYATAVVVQKYRDGRPMRVIAVSSDSEVTD